MKHADVQEAWLRVWEDGNEIKLVVEDRGNGFDPDSAAHAGELGAGFGLLAVRERARLFGGRYEIDTKPGAGTRVTVVMPTALG